MAQADQNSEDIMYTLEADTGTAVRRELAHNPRLSLDLLGRLASCVKVGTTLLPRIR
ncbi:hypothetical protein [Streptomyces colonosanans]|uniref:hypothetical protein n=1 Tax=Streptomyces colonosanans TaxID=1428652 RepID=UPI0015A7082C|nr:hypothetical protein [Streptomyces colonosanans]